MASHEDRLVLTMRRNADAARLYPGEMLTMDALGRTVPLSVAMAIAGPSPRVSRLVAQARASHDVVRDTAAKLAHMFFCGSNLAQVIEIKDKVGHCVSEAALFAFRNEAIEKNTDVHSDYIIDCLKLVMQEVLKTRLPSAELQAFGLDVSLVFMRSIVAAEMAKLHAIE
jgi:hypothetical protein